MEQTNPQDQPQTAGQAPDFSPLDATPATSSPRNKPIIVAFMAVAVLAVVGVGVAVRTRLARVPSVRTPGRQVTLTYWGTWDRTPELERVIDDFESRNPGLTIEYSPQSPKDYKERLQSACGRGQCPDLFRFHATWTPTLTTAGMLSTLPASIMNSQDFTQTFYPMVQQNLQTDQGFVGIPLMTDGLGLFINTRMLRASGKSAPMTWDELRMLGRELTVRGPDGKIERSGLALGGTTNIDHFSDVLGVLIFQNGGNPAQPDEGLQVAEALEFYTQFKKEDKVWEDNLPNSTYAFAIEKAAMIIAPYWRVQEIKEINPNFEFQVYPIPQLPAQQATWANYWVEGVSSATPEQQLAWEFLQYLSTKEVLSKLTFSSPESSRQLELPSRVDMADAILSDPFAGAFIQQSMYARSWYLSSRTFDPVVNDPVIAAYTAALDSVAQGQRSDVAVRNLAAEIKAIFQRATQGVVAQ